jgi:AAA+ ATPase superfamily predicted ATPase
MNRDIIGRQREVKILRNVLTNRGSQFVGLYGRRRVGKTYLIRQVYKADIKYECTAMHGVSKRVQLEHFWRELLQVHRSKDLPPTSWAEAFARLAEYLTTVKPGKSGKKVVFLDEISWYDTPRSGFLPAFTQFWNGYCDKQTDIVLVICGSAASWIIEKIVNNRGGLHNRLTRTLRLLPFDLQDASKLLAANRVKLSKKDIIQLYMLVGGIPYYLNLVERGKGIAGIMDDLFFGEQAALAREFDNLYAALFKNHEKHLAVVSALSNKGKGLTRKQIIQSTKLASGGWLTLILEELEQCGFIVKSRDIDKASEDGLYRLIDEYTLFYYKFLANKRTSTTGAGVANSQSFKVWSGFAFENLCIKHHKLIAQALGFPGIAYDVYSFVDKGTLESDGSQIDMVIDRADPYINVVEAKYHNEPYKMTKSAAQSITHKVNSLRRKTGTAKTIFTTLVTVRGAVSNTHFTEVVTNEVIFEELM